MRPARSTNMRGFTLLEVLISTVLLASVFVAVVGLSSQSLRNLNRLPAQGIALSYAREKMNQILLLEDLQPGTTSGSWGGGYQWEARISPNAHNANSSDPDHGLFDIQVVISWGEGPAKKTYSVETTQWAKKVTSYATH